LPVDRITGPGVFALAPEVKLKPFIRYTPGGMPTLMGGIRPEFAWMSPSPFRDLGEFGSAEVIDADEESAVRMGDGDIRVGAVVLVPIGIGELPATPILGASI